MGAMPNLRRGAWMVMLTMTASPLLYAQHDEHPFIMPGTPAKTVPAPAPWHTGAQLLQLLERGDAETIEYIKGVFDATESGLWCYTDHRRRSTPKQSPETMRKQAVGFLRGLPRTRLKERGAALIIEMWQIRWPCPPDGCCPGLRGM